MFTKATGCTHRRLLPSQVLHNLSLEGVLVHRDPAVKFGVVLRFQSNFLKDDAVPKTTPQISGTKSQQD